MGPTLPRPGPMLPRVAALVEADPGMTPAGGMPCQGAGFFTVAVGAKPVHEDPDRSVAGIAQPPAQRLAAVRDGELDVRFGSGQCGGR